MKKIKYATMLFVLLLIATLAFAVPEKSDNWLDMDIRILETDDRTDWDVRVWATSYLDKPAELDFKLIAIYWNASEGTTKKFKSVISPGRQMLSFNMKVKKDEARNDLDVEATYGNHHYRDGINTLLRYDPALVEEENAPQTPGEILEGDVRAQAEKKLAEMGLDAKGNPLPEEQKSPWGWIIAALSALVTVVIIIFGVKVLRKPR